MVREKLFNNLKKNTKNCRKNINSQLKTTLPLEDSSRIKNLELAKKLRSLKKQMKHCNLKYQQH